MRLYHWQGPAGNFGDDLNPWFWSRLIPDLRQLGDDTVVFAGVGSLFHEALPVGSRNVIFGSGAGYDAIPRRQYQFYALRGPLTARALRAPEGTALGDPAVLIPRLLEPGRCQSGVGPTVFVPHWTTMDRGGWEAPCTRNGCVLVDPRSHYRSVIEQIAGARLVLAESLHAAIVADAFRVPWIPLVCTHSMPFKWRDWLTNLGLDYTPHRLEHPAFERLTLRSQDQSRELGGEFVLRRLGRSESLRRRVQDRVAELLFERSSRVRTRLIDARTRRLADLLRTRPGTLSHPERLRACQEALLAALDRFRADWKSARHPVLLGTHGPSTEA